MGRKHRRNPQTLEGLSTYEDWGPVKSVAFHPDGHTIASSGNHKTIRLRDVETGELLKQLRHVDNVNSVAFHPDDHTLASASDDGTIRLWDIETGERLRTLEIRQYIGFLSSVYRSPVFSVAFHPDGHIIASSSKDNAIRLWDARTGGRKS